MSARLSRYRSLRRALCVILLGLAFAGCDSNDNDSFLGLGEISFRGQLVQEPTRVTLFSTSDLNAALADPSRAALAQLAGAPVCNVEVHHFQYRTIGAQDENTVASGALMVPAGDHERCRGERPIVLYGHGTAVERAFNLANVSLSSGGESFVLAAGFAAHGYIVVAPNLAGYDTSTLPYHPYLNADQNAKDMIDALRAARRALPTSSAPDTRADSKLFITGYSAGGHVAMATHRALEEEDIQVTAAAPMSGPYALSTFGDMVYHGQVNLGATVFSVLIATSYQRAYGDLYDAATELFEVRYANGIESLLPSNVPASDLFAQGLLPQLQLFSNTPPAPEYASITPPVTQSPFAPLHAVAFGPDHLLTNTSRLDYLRDAEANPDGAFPTVTTNQPPANPGHPLRVALKRNDLRNWTPEAPVLLCGGNGDPTVYYVNTELMQAYWSTRSAQLTVLDVDSPVTPGERFEAHKAAFAAAKAEVEANGIVQLLLSYHGLVSPYCTLAARAFFDGF